MKLLRFNLMLFILCSTSLLSVTLAQDVPPTPVPDDAPIEVPERVEIQPSARDDQIEQRLQEILLATGWFDEPQVRVNDGVVFLSGEAQREDFKTWAGDLARNTQDVAAVVNQINVAAAPVLDFNPVITGLREQGRAFVRALPQIAFSLVFLFLAWVGARYIAGGSRRYINRWELNPLLRNVIARAIGFSVFLLALYIVFQVAGLTNIALTILGGTGLLGIVLGIAFRDITENFLASIFLSLQNPYSVGDLVEINEVLGFIQRMTTRTTILMTLSGNHVQIPNATVYKSIIYNYTSNPNRRVDFVVGIGYDDSISLAQETIRRVLEEHPAVLNDPEHLVLVDHLGSSTVNLQIYFWLDGTKHSWLKVKSSVIRLVKKAIQDTGISMPDEARELIFPDGVPVNLIREEAPTATWERDKDEQPIENESISTDAEGGLSSEAEEIEWQAQHSRTPEGGENLLSDK